LGKQEETMSSPGQQLRGLREQLGLTMRGVENASTILAQRHGSTEFAISLSRLSDLETKGVVPTIHRIYSLAVIYRCDFKDVLRWYGVDLDDLSNDLGVLAPPKSHVSKAIQGSGTVRIPVRLDPGFDPRRTSNLGRMIEQWGLVPLAYLGQFAQNTFTYGYVGTEDFGMYPLLLPGTFVQVDETKNRVVAGMWRSEYERPIYFVETREGFTCSWCDVMGDTLVLRPHPLSPVTPRMMRFPREAEVVGQVVGIAMRLGDCRPVDSGPAPKGRSVLT
jgi:transcriptional regulator with XRE-family HTH domain